MKKVNLLFNLKALFDYDAICHSIYNRKRIHDPSASFPFDKEVEEKLKKYIDCVRPHAYSISLCILTSKSNPKDL